jgi:hypothetical protein
LWEDDRLLWQVISDWKAQAPEVYLVDAVLARLPVRNDLRRRSREGNGEHNVNVRDFSTETVTWKSYPTKTAPPRRWALLAVVAAVLVLSGPLLLIDEDRTPTPRGDSGQPTALVNAVPVPSDARQSADSELQLNHLIRDATSAYLELAHDAAAAVRDAVVFVPDPVKVPDVRSQLPAAPAFQPSWNMSLEPIGHDLEKALDFLMQSVSRGQG